LHEDVSLLGEVSRRSWDVNLSLSALEGDV